MAVELLVYLLVISSLFTGSFIPAVQVLFRGLGNVYKLDSTTDDFGSYLLSNANNVKASLEYIVERNVNRLIPFDTFRYDNIKSKMKFYLYTRQNLLYPDVLVPSNPSTIYESHYQPGKKTVVLVHGFTADFLSSDGLNLIKTELLENEDLNVIGVDYGPLTDIGWFKIFSPCGMVINALQAPMMGMCIGEMVSDLIDVGQSRDSVHLVGHSLGAHLVGFAGKYLSSINKKIYRITGLDPSSPGFSAVSSAHRLAKDDAIFTDCIFTSARAIAVGNQPCQANFYPNGCGVSQPGCYFGDFLGGCSHSRVVYLFADSVSVKYSGFPTKVCNVMPCVGSEATCWPTNETTMGYWANPSMKGIYYTTTNAESPFLTPA